MTARGQKTLAVIALFGFLLMLGIAGAIETQPNPTCADYQASQDWELALRNDCPFTDSQGNYLYTWQPNSH
jgi:hypothetical protein